MITKEILCSYQPYDLRFITHETKPFTMNYCFTDDYGKLLINYYERFTRWNARVDEGLKLILRPLSDLTKPIVHNGETFVPEYSLSKNRKIIYENGSFWYYKTESHTSGDAKWCGAEKQIELFQKLHAWHFDLYNLIPQGYAIDLNTIENKA